MDQDWNGPAVVDAVERLLASLGQDTRREGLQNTPARVARFWRTFVNRPSFDFTAFDAEGMDEMVVQCGIPFYSMCEHHLLPFFGHAAVGYVPKGRIVGLSKLARTVRHFAHGPQNQERLTSQVADLIVEKLGPMGVGVVLRARHLCMEMRGVEAPGTWTVTSKMVGVFREDARCREEFLALARDGWDK